MFATINIKKMGTWSVLKRRLEHNNRVNGALKNDDPRLMHLNEYGSMDSYENINNLYESINKERVSNGVRLMRQDTVPAVELVLGASKDFFNGKSEDFIQDWKKVQLDWARDYYKERGEIMDIAFHRSERTPHLHITFAPVTKDPKGNRTFSKYKFQGGLKEMRSMRSSHAKANTIFNLERGQDYFKTGEEQPNYTDDINEFRRQTAKAKKIKKKQISDIRKLKVQVSGLLDLKIKALNFFNPSKIRSMVQNFNWEASGWGAKREEIDNHLDTKKTVLEIIRANESINTNNKIPPPKEANTNLGDIPKPKPDKL
ncbi:MAG TPA: hypothetical protein EYN33_06485 [Gammaproteobacteria bacterium]|nr:hypothetical protein [Gammaproteobacteria bacterium]